MAGVIAIVTSLSVLALVMAALNWRLCVTVERISRANIELTEAARKGQMVAIDRVIAVLKPEILPMIAASEAGREALAARRHALNPKATETVRL